MDSTSPYTAGHARPRHRVLHIRLSHHMAGRQGPMGKQRLSPSGQRSSPIRAPTRTCQGEWAVGQGDLLHTKEATSVSRMHGNHKEQHLSHSLDRWKERFALQHRHAGMSTGSEPYTLRGILDRGAWALMTRLGSPQWEKDLGHSPTSDQHRIIVSEFSVCIYYTEFYQQYDNSTMCSIERRIIPSDRAVVQYYIHHQRVLQNVQLKGGQLLSVRAVAPVVSNLLVEFLLTGQWP